VAEVLSELPLQVAHDPTDVVYRALRAKLGVTVAGDVPMREQRANPVVRNADAVRQDGVRPSLEKILPRQRGVEGLDWGFRLFCHPSSA